MFWNLKVFNILKSFHLPVRFRILTFVWQQRRCEATLECEQVGPVGWPGREEARDTTENLQKQ